MTVTARRTHIPVHALNVWRNVADVAVSMAMEALESMDGCAMPDSAALCVEDARTCLMERDYFGAVRRAKRAIAYIHGSYSEEWQEVETMFQTALEIADGME
jgi:hypothetical protein